MNIPNKSFVALLIFAIVLTILSGTWGQFILAKSALSNFDFPSALYNSLKAITLDDNYQEMMGTEPLLWQLSVSRWLGASIAFTAGFAILSRIFANNVARLRSSNWKGHIVVIGGGEFALALVSKIAEDGYRVLHLSNSYLEAAKVKNLIQMPFSEIQKSGIEFDAINGAKKIIVTAESDVRAIAIALKAKEIHSKSEVFCRVYDRWQAMSFTSGGGYKIRAFSQSDAASREIVRRHFPFLLAEDFGQEQINALLVGDHNWIESILSEIILSTRTIKLGIPKFSIFTNSPIDFKKRILARYPEINKEAEFEFYELDLLAYNTLFERGLPSSITLEKITCTYCAFDNPEKSFEVANALRAWGVREPNFYAPIFVRLDQSDGFDIAKAGEKLAKNDIIPFGTIRDILKATDLVSEFSDTTEKEWQEVYLKTVKPGKPAAKPWDELDEEYRISNRRAVAHVYAKLFEAGIDIRPFMASGKYWNELPKLNEGGHLFTNEQERLKLAELEHLRWNADRRLQGWIYGDTRDDEKKIHDNLCDFKDLSEEIRGYDIAFIDDLDNKFKGIE